MAPSQLSRRRDIHQGTVHCSFFDLRDRTLIAGDAYQTLGDVAVSGTLTIFPLPALSTWHKPNCLVSARKLRALSPSRLAVGHGRILNQPLAALDHKLERQVKQQVTATRRA